MTEIEQRQLREAQRKCKHLSGMIDNIRLNHQRQLERQCGLKDQERAAVDAYAGELQLQLEQSRLKIAAIESELAAIRSTLGWQIVSRAHRVVEKLFPPETVRRKFYEKSKNLLVFFRRGPGADQAVEKDQHCPPEQEKKGPDEAAAAAAAGALSSFSALADNEVEVSIIIPVYNNWKLTASCLRSVADNTDGAFEVIVVDNNSTDATSHLLAAVKNLHVIHNTVNRVFVEGCNQGAEMARGRYLLFLNNDTEVCAGWLDALLVPFADHSTGIVGAKLIYPDQRLQEAGSIVWQDGTGWNYGHGEDQHAPEYNYRREVDYCSGACLIIPRFLWDTIGGFDARYAPAYYEDTDLCFAVRDAGYKVIYQPEARVIHHGGASAGKDVDSDSGYKKFQRINQQKFVEKWKQTLSESHFSGPSELYRARERGVTQRILVVDHYVPTFDKDSGSLRMFNILKILVSMGFKVIFWPDNGACDVRYVQELQRLGIETLYAFPDFEKFIMENGRHIDFALLSRPTVAPNYLDLVREYSQATIIYDTVDLHFLREARHFELEVKRLKELEFGLAESSDVTLVVSPVEKKLLENESFGEKVHLLSNIHEVTAPVTPFPERHGAIFIGGFDHTPNIDAMVWFVNNIMPEITAEIDDFSLTIIGSNPRQEILELASERVTVTGYVPDVSEYFEKAKLFVSPLLYGAGVKGKLGQSFSLGLPVVTTSVGAEGMGLEDHFHAVIADTEEAFIAGVVELYNDAKLWQKLSKNAAELITEKFGVDEARRSLEKILGHRHHA